MTSFIRTALLSAALAAAGGGTVAAQPADEREAYEVIVGFYQRYLKRSPMPREVNTHLRNMARNGSSLREVEAVFLGSPEYFQMQRNSPRRWVRAMTDDVHGRDADRDQVAHWLGRLDELAGDRTQVAREFLDSAPARRFEPFEGRRSPRRDYEGQYPRGW